MIKRSTSALIKIVFALNLALVSSVAFAAAEKVHMDRMLNGSALVIQGTVTGLRVEQGAHARSIHTIVTLEIIDTIKGAWEQPTIDISFLGGSVNGLTLNVGGQHIPEFGQEGVFFIENPLRNQVNPLYGWEQGLFIIEADADSGEKIIKTATKESIQQIEFLPANDSQVQGISNGTAAGVKTQQSAELNTPYTLDQFKATLRTRLEEGK